MAFYLPQFHAIPENDEWWGRGFTEWITVAAARPLFRGHPQPDLPGELGFYDLTVPEVRARQVALARSYGISAFCYYHYWFAGRHILERPFEEVLRSGDPDFPFCICWANENWTRAWDGEAKAVLLHQQYDEDDDRAHARWLARAMRDERYVRVGGRPLLLVYRASDLPAPRRTADIFRHELAAARVGDVLLCRVESNFPDERGHPSEVGFDAAVEFQPDSLSLSFGGIDRGRRMVRRALGRRRPPVIPYDRAREVMLAKPSPPYLRFPGVTPGWDNTPRRGERGWVLGGASPAAFQGWVSTVAGRLRSARPEHRLIFINAWNEWGEGAHLEPGRRWGRAFLEAHGAAMGALGWG